MSRPRRMKVSPATVIALVALVVALGGAAYAALKLPKNSVKSKNIVNGQVKSSDLAKKAVKASNLKAGSVTGTALAPDAIDSSKVRDGSLLPADVGSIVGRPRGSGDVQSSASGPVSYPMSNNTWNQGANELDELVSTVNYTTPPSCSSPGGFALGSATISVDGNTVTTASLFGTPFNTAKTLTVTGFVPEPGSATPHTLTVSIGGSCSGAGEVFTVHSISVDVVAFG